MPPPLPESPDYLSIITFTAFDTILVLAPITEFGIHTPSVCQIVKDIYPTCRSFAIVRRPSPFAGSWHAFTVMSLVWNGSQRVWHPTYLFTFFESIY